MLLRSLTRSLIVPVAFFVMLVGCAAPSAPPEPKPHVARIRVLPVMPIERLYTDNKGIPVGVLWQAIADRVKSNDFTQRMESTRLGLGPKFTAALVESLKAEGFEASVMEGVERPPKSPENIDYTRRPAGDPILHVYIPELRMYSSRFSLDYIPRVNVSALLMRAQSDDAIYSESLYYGADSRGTASWSIPADPRFKWPSFSALVERPEVVAESYEAAVSAIAHRIAANIRAEASPVASK